MSEISLKPQINNDHSTHYTRQENNLTIETNTPSCVEPNIQGIKHIDEYNEERDNTRNISEKLTQADYPIKGNLADSTKTINVQPLIKKLFNPEINNNSKNIDNQVENLYKWDNNNANISYKDLYTTQSIDEPTKSPEKNSIVSSTITLSSYHINRNPPKAEELLILKGQRTKQKIENLSRELYDYPRIPCITSKASKLQRKENVYDRLYELDKEVRSKSKSIPKTINLPKKSYPNINDLSKPLNNVNRLSPLAFDPAYSTSNKKLNQTMISQNKNYSPLINKSLDKKFSFSDAKHDTMPENLASTPRIQLKLNIYQNLQVNPGNSKKGESSNSPKHAISNSHQQKRTSESHKNTPTQQKRSSFANFNSASKVPSRKLSKNIDLGSKFNFDNKTSLSKSPTRKTNQIIDQNQTKGNLKSSNFKPKCNTPKQGRTNVSSPNNKIKNQTGAHTTTAKHQKLNLSPNDVPTQGYYEAFWEAILAESNTPNKVYSMKNQGINEETLTNNNGGKDQNNLIKEEKSNKVLNEYIFKDFLPVKKSIYKREKISTTFFDEANQKSKDHLPQTYTKISEEDLSSMKKKETTEDNVKNPIPTTFLFNNARTEEQELEIQNKLYMYILDN